MMAGRWRVGRDVLLVLLGVEEEVLLGGGEELLLDSLCLGEGGLLRLQALHQVLDPRVSCRQKKFLSNF